METKLTQIDPKALQRFYKQFAMVDDSSVTEVGTQGWLGKATTGEFVKRNFITYDLLSESEENDDAIEHTIAIPTFYTNRIVNSLKHFDEPIDVVIEYDSPNLNHINTDDSIYPEHIAHKLTFINNKLKLSIGLAQPNNVRCIPNDKIGEFMNVDDSAYHFSFTKDALADIKNLTTYSHSVSTSSKKEGQQFHVFLKDDKVCMSDDEGNWEYVVGSYFGNLNEDIMLTLSSGVIDIIDSEEYIMYAMNNDKGRYAVLKSTETNTFCFIASANY